MRKVAYVSIVGASGYIGAGDARSRARAPDLELYAIGSDSLAGREAMALDPRLNRNGGRRVPHFITNEAALACGADVTFVCLPARGGCAIEPPARGVVVDLSGAHRFADPVVYEEWYGFTHPRPARARPLELRAPRARAAHGRSRRQPRLLRDGGTARAVAAARPRRPRVGRRRRQVGDDGRGALAEGQLPCRLRARELCAVQGGRAPARPRDRRAARLSDRLRAAPAACPARPDRHVLRRARPAPTCAACSRSTTPRATSSRCSRRGWRPSSRASSTPTPPSSASSRTGSPGCTIVVCAIDNLGKGAAGQAVQNVNLLFGFAETAGLRLSGVLV